MCVCVCVCVCFFVLTSLSCFFCRRRPTWCKRRYRRRRQLRQHRCALHIYLGSYYIYEHIHIYIFIYLFIYKFIYTYISATGGAGSCGSTGAPYIYIWRVIIYMYIYTVYVYIYLPIYIITPGAAAAAQVRPNPIYRLSAWPRVHLI